MFQSHQAAFGAFHAAALLGVLAVIGPAVVLSGAVLPLLFHAMRRELGDLGAQAGRLYSVNTVGSLIGALVGGYVLLTWFDLSDVYRIAIGSLALAAALVTGRLYQRLGWSGAAGLLLAALALIALFAPWRPAHLMPGLIRSRVPTSTTYEMPPTEPRRNFTFYQDDPTSSVGILEKGTGETFARGLIVNGKADGNTLTDVNTMVLLGVLPALFAERAERAFVIGFGLGISAGELAELSHMREVRVAEISSAVIEGAPLFDYANHGASKHPKIRIIRSDAYRSLLRSEGLYDVIVSEPSNPWVTSVEMLYTREFLEAARDRLTPGGVYTQWFHIYESDTETVELVLRTYTEVFDHVAVWQTGLDLLLMGFRNAEIALDVSRLTQRAQRKDFRRALTRIGIRSPAALLVHEVLPLGVARLARREGGRLQTLYSPVLSHQSARAFFRGDAAEMPFTGYGEPARVGFENSLLRRRLAQFDGDVPDPTWQQILQRACDTRLRQCAVFAAQWARERPDSKLRIAMMNRLRSQNSPAWLPLLPRLAMFLGEPPPSARVSPSVAVAASRQFDGFYSHAIPFDPKALVSVWRRCGQTRELAQRCKRGLENAEQLAAGRSETAPRSWSLLPGSELPGLARLAEDMRDQVPGPDSITPSPIPEL
jgi:spermidine synthase